MLNRSLPLKARRLAVPYRLLSLQSETGVQSC